MNDKLSEIYFCLLEPELLHLIQPLWEELNRHHAALPTPFASEIAGRRFASRLQALRDKAAAGSLRAEIACPAAGEPPVAYCLTSLSADGAGEVESLFVAPSHRRIGVGSELVRRALAWLRDSGAVSQRVVVLHANAEAGAFYGRFGFHPRNIELEQLPKPRHA